MRIWTKQQLITAALLTSVVFSVAAMVIHTQRKVLREQSLRRLNTFLEGAARIAKESFDSRDRLMAISYLKFLQKEHPELAFASVSYGGHVSLIGEESGGLKYLEHGAPPGNQGVSVRLGFTETIIDDEIRNALEPLIRRTAVITAVFLVLGLFVNFWLAKLLTGPIEVLAQATGLLAAGRMDVTVPVNSRDELGMLTRSFNSMAVRLKGLMESREDILHTLTHEINTPLNGLKGFLELQLDQKLPQDAEEHKDMIGTMMVAVLRMENSLSSALGLFRSENKPLLKKDTRPLQVEEIIKHTLAMFEPMAKAKRINISPPHKAITGCITAHEEPLTQIVVNLVSNALKYTPEGGQIRIGLHDNPSELMLHVSNSGYGIPPENIPHLFTKFYRSGADRAAGKRIPGTGLGLNIVYKAVQSLGGKIYVTSKLDEVTVFVVRLPKSAEKKTESKAEL